MKIEINTKAYRDIKALQEKDATKILAEMKDLASFPNSKNIKKLTNFKPSYRKRVGEYRVLFEVEHDTIVVYRVIHRKDAYK